MPDIVSPNPMPSTDTPGLWGHRTHKQDVPCKKQSWADRGSVRRREKLKGEGALLIADPPPPPGYPPSPHRR